jgi:uncharacterized protein
MEKRNVRLREVRVEGGEAGKPRYLVGYAAVFESPSQVLADDEGNPFVEVLTAGCFAETLESGDVFAFVSHDERVLGRTGSGTLELTEDETGLAFRCELPDVTYANDLAVSVGRRDVTGCSFGFSCDPEDEQLTEGDDGIPVRRINRAQLVEVSLGVCFPAYLATSVSLRSLRDRKAGPAPAPTKGPGPLAAAKRFLKLMKAY